MRCPTCDSDEIEEIALYSSIELYAYECKDCDSVFERKNISND